MRLFAAVTIAIALSAAAPAFADAQAHVAAAKKAEKRKEWRKALGEWKAAYAQDVNAEYLIGIGDAYSHLGNKAEAKKSYEAYLADPLALPRNVDKVKSKIAALGGASGETLALPGAGLALPGATAAAAAPAPLPLPGLDLPAATETAKAQPPGLDLPGAPPKEVAAAELTLPGAKTKKNAVPAVQEAAKPAPAKPIAMVTAPPAAAPAAVPAAAITATPAPHGAAPASGVQRSMAYVTAGVAVIALGGGALAFSKANAAHSDLTGSVHSGAEAEQLLQTESRNKTLSFVGFAGGLALAGISAALFAF
ncbi:MAG TPA: hypothetical protein VFE90_16440 [Myxococcales bacterium]|nr:hypothetical protein [Myxococcales bacterium]